MASMNHLGGCSYDTPDPCTWMPDVWERLIRERDVKTVLDLGCGAGFSLGWWRRHVSYAVGVEGDPKAIACAHLLDPGANIISWDLTRGPCPGLGESDFDLGWCAEFVEHVEARYMPNWMAALRRCRFVCMTYAVPKQPGYHHVNCQYQPYWEARFREAGFALDEDETRKLRATWRQEPWGRNTLTFFTRRP